MNTDFVRDLLEYYRLVCNGADNLQLLDGTMQLGVTLGFNPMQITEHHSDREQLLIDLTESLSGAFVATAV